MDDLILLLMFYIQEKDWIRACELYDIRIVIVAQYIIEHTSIDDIDDLVHNYMIVTDQDINEYRDEVAKIQQKIDETY